MVQVLRSLAEGLVPVQCTNSLDRHRVRERALARPRATSLPHLYATSRLVDLWSRAASGEPDIVVIGPAAAAAQALEVGVRALVAASGTRGLGTAAFEVAQHVVVVACFVLGRVWTRCPADVLAASA